MRVQSTNKKKNQEREYVREILGREESKHDHSLTKWPKLSRWSDGIATGDLLQKSSISQTSSFDKYVSSVSGVLDFLNSAILSKFDHGW